MGRRQIRKKKLPQSPLTVTIEALSHDGRGIAHVNGKVVFIDEALPGEELAFVYTDSRRDYAEGRIERLLTRSESRVKPKCPHFGRCGGCNFQHVEDALQIQLKQTWLVEQFSRLGKVDITEIWEPLSGPHWGYRSKARMGVKYVAKKGRVLVGFRERRNPFLADIESCPVMHPIVGEKLMDLSSMIGQLTIRNKIPQIEVAMGDEDCVLAFRVLQPPTSTDQQIMSDFGREHGISICLQSKGPDTIVPIPGDPEVIPAYLLPEQQIRFKFRAAMFTQVNYEINRKMVTRVMLALDLNKDDQVLDLFCGLGNFTLPMATQAGQVTGIEADLPLVKQARENARLNKLENVDFYVADLSQDITGYSWSQQSYNKVLLDPSRAGAAEILPYLQRLKPQRIVYVSCNPSTLARDAGILVNDMGYRLIKAGVMDMFPQTAHVESIAMFEQ